MYQSMALTDEFCFEPASEPEILTSALTWHRLVIPGNAYIQTEPSTASLCILVSRYAAALASFFAFFSAFRFARSSAVSSRSSPPSVFTFFFF